MGVSADVRCFWSMLLHDIIQPKVFHVPVFTGAFLFSPICSVSQAAFTPPIAIATPAEQNTTWHTGKGILHLLYDVSHDKWIDYRSAPIPPSKKKKRRHFQLFQFNIKTSSEPSTSRFSSPSAGSGDRDGFNSFLSLRPGLKERWCVRITFGPGTGHYGENGNN